jgi:hypothetical protein
MSARLKLGGLLAFDCRLRDGPVPKNKTAPGDILALQVENLVRSMCSTPYVERRKNK